MGGSDGPWLGQGMAAIADSRFWTSLGQVRAMTRAGGVAGTDLDTADSDPPEASAAIPSPAPIASTGISATATNALRRRLGTGKVVVTDWFMAILQALLVVSRPGVLAPAGTGEVVRRYRCGIKAVDG
jgi:hypothetical protein